MSEGKSHPVQDLVQKVREVLITLGFDEIENKIFVPEEDVYKQYGQEAPVILDRVYYLAGLTRPDIGLSDEKLGEVMDILDRAGNKDKDFDKKIKNIFRRYREGSIEGDDLLEIMVDEFDILTEYASQIIDLFPEFKNITPVPSKTTLRSHMTGAWFPTIAALKGMRELPMKLFSVGMRFRREQKLDATHLRAHYGGSMVIVDKKVSLAEGKKITEQILNELDFGDIKFVKKKATSNYYVPDTEYEVFSDDVEVADIGLYNKGSLAKYDIDYDVFNLGFGLERILMVKKGIADVRELLYPQFYKVVELSDEEIAEQVKIDRTPETPDGKKLADAIKKAAYANVQEKSPCKFLTYEGSLSGKKIRVNVLEKEENTKLLGPAALNKIYVYDGNIYGLPEDVSKLKKGMTVVKEKGMPLKFDFLDAVSSYFAAEIESAVQTKKAGLLQIKMAKGPSDINVEIGDVARRFIASKNNQISLKGPVFMAVEYNVV